MTIYNKHRNPFEVEQWATLSEQKSIANDAKFLAVISREELALRRAKQDELQAYVFQGQRDIDIDPAEFQRRLEVAREEFTAFEFALDIKFGRA